MSRPLAISLALVAAVVLGAAWMLGVFDGPRETPAGTSDVPATSAPAEPAPAAPSAPATSRAPRPEPRASDDVPEIRTPLPPPPTTGSLTIESDVVGADVFIDNAFVGKVPASVDAVTPGRRKISVSAPGYETVTEFVDVSPGPAVVRIDLKMIRLDRRVSVTHRHRMGSCEGTLIASPSGLQYTTDRRQDAFTARLTDIDAIEADYLARSLKVTFGGRTHTFTVPQERVDQMYELYQDVEKAREQLRQGGL